MALEDCTHHWVLEPPAGQWSKAICRNCRIQSRFPNSLETAVDANRLYKKRARS